MASASLSDPTRSQAAWDSMVSAAPGGHVLQSWAWGELKTRFGWQTRRVAVGPTAAQVLFRALPAKLGTIAYIPRGPVVAWDDPTRLEELLQAIVPVARHLRAICLKVEPNVQDDAEVASRLCAVGFRPSPHSVQPARTIVVDLDGEPTALQARMKQKTRYNIRLAARQGVVVREGSELDLPAFYRTMQVTAERDDFAIHSQAYFEHTFRLFVPTGQGCLLLAEHEGQMLAGILVLALGDTAIYMAGASSDSGRQLMPSYLLQWEAMRWAKAQGCRTYDLWGVPDEEEDTLEAQFVSRRDGLWGVYRFKRGFGGRLVRTIGTWDLVYRPIPYRLYALAAKRLGQRQMG